MSEHTMTNWMAAVVGLSLMISLYRMIRGPVARPASTQSDHAIACVFMLVAIMPPYVWWLLRYFGWNV